jgi:hypothetical protein
LAIASALGVRLIGGCFIDRDDAVRAVCFITGALVERAVFTARVAGLAQPEAIAFVAPLALAFAKYFLTGWESFFVMVVLSSLGAISQYVHAVIRKAKARAAPCSSSTLEHLIRRGIPVKPVHLLLR